MLIDPTQTRVLGPLSAFAAGFGDELARQGYRPRAADYLMRLLTHLSRWLAGEGLSAGGLHTTEVERFFCLLVVPLVTRGCSRVKLCSPYSHTCAISAWCPHHRRPRPAVRWKWRWSDTEATWRLSAAWEPRPPAGVSRRCVSSFRAGSYPMASPWTLAA
jgi:hypothetical protein